MNQEGKLLSETVRNILSYQHNEQVFDMLINFNKTRTVQSDLLSHSLPQSQSSVAHILTHLLPFRVNQPFSTQPLSCISVSSKGHCNSGFMTQGYIW